MEKFIVSLDKFLQICENHESLSHENLFEYIMFVLFTSELNYSDWVCVNCVLISREKIVTCFNKKAV